MLSRIVQFRLSRPHLILLVVVLSSIAIFTVSIINIRRMSKRSVAASIELKNLVPRPESIAESAIDRMLADNLTPDDIGLPLKYRIPQDMSEAEFEQLTGLVVQEFLKGVDVEMGHLNSSNRYTTTGDTEHRPWYDPQTVVTYVNVASRLDLQYQRHPEQTPQALLDRLSAQGYLVQQGSEVRKLPTWKDYDQGDKPYYNLLTIWGMERTSDGGLRAILTMNNPDYFEQLTVQISPPDSNGQRLLHWEQYTMGCG